MGTQAQLGAVFILDKQLLRGLSLSLITSYNIKQKVHARKSKGAL